MQITILIFAVLKTMELKQNILKISLLFLMKKDLAENNLTPMVIEMI